MIAGNRLSRSADGIQENYRYDNCNRLTQMTRMTTQQEHLTYTYDRQGNMLSDGRNQYTYDDFGRLVLAVTAEGGIQKNCYDAEGLRTEMEENGRLVQFLYNENREVVAEKDYSGNIIRYIRGLGLISSDSENAKMYYHYVCDGQGSVSHIIRGGDKENGAAVQDKDQDRVLNHYEYDVFGNTISCAERVANRFRYQSGSKTVNPNALKYNGDGTWTSNEGLIYGQGSIHGNRVKHVIAHTQPDPSKPTHTMYNVDKSQVIGLIDEAWVNKGQGIMQRNGNVKYEIDMGRVVGANGETSIRIITNGYSNNIVTAFPVQ